MTKRQKELRNRLSLADNDIIRGGLGLVTDKTKKNKKFKKLKNRAFFNSFAHKNIT